MIILTMGTVIQILTSLILLGILILIGLAILFVIKQPQISKLLPKKTNAVIFDDEPKTEEEIAIEREERILKTLGTK
jgi:hypothetical protein